jgi:hypothetical protein
VQKRRQDKMKAMAAKARKAATHSGICGSAPAIHLDEEAFEREMGKVVERDMETFAAEEALDSQRAIYKVSINLLNTSHV